MPGYVVRAGEGWILFAVCCWRRRAVRHTAAGFRAACMVADGVDRLHGGFRAAAGLLLLRWFTLRREYIACWRRFGGVLPGFGRLLSRQQVIGSSNRFVESVRDGCYGWQLGRSIECIVLNRAKLAPDTLR